MSTILPDYAMNPDTHFRVIPRLDIKGPNLVKGVHLEGLRVLGRPEYFAFTYAVEGADELLYMDVVASLYGRNSLTSVIERTAREIFIPLTVGGGLRSIDDIRTVLRAGADKVAINTAAIRNPAFVKEAARRFGSSTIVVSIEAMRRANGQYECYTDNGRERTGLDAFSWAQQVAELGAGEILVTSIDNEGTGKGFDIELTRRIAATVPVPVIAAGGASSPRHVAEVASAGRCQAACVAAMFHYGLIQRQRGEAGHGEGVTAFLESGREHTRFSGAMIADVKLSLADAGLATRPCDETAHA